MRGHDGLDIALVDGGTRAGRKTVRISAPDHVGETVITVPVEAEERSWFSPTMLALAGLLLLPENWDSCGAPRIEPGAAESAISLLG